MTHGPTLPGPGAVIAGKYRVEHVLGTGGMGIVFHVTHRVTGKRFALKWLLPEVASNADSAKRFIREAQVAGRFEHPNVVEVYDVGSDAGSFYMVMELLEGETLAEYVERKGALSVADACRLLVPCMRGVAEAHAVGIVHRDLKPANIFVCRATKETPERAKVLDFGISKMSVMPGELSSSMTRSGVLIGTPFYMPLEQMRGKPVDHRVDVYAFGVVLYQVLSGKLPYQADSFSDLVLLVANAASKSLDQLLPGLPKGLARVVSQALARNPEDRQPTLQALIDALAPFDVKSGTPPQPARKSARAVGGGTRTESANDELSQLTPLSTESQPDLPRVDRQSMKRRMWLIGGTTAAALVCGLAAWWLQSPNPELPRQVRQLTPAEAVGETAQHPGTSPGMQRTASEPGAESPSTAETSAGAEDDVPKLDIVRIEPERGAGEGFWQLAGGASGQGEESAAGPGPGGDVENGRTDRAAAQPAPTAGSGGSREPGVAAEARASRGGSAGAKRGSAVGNPSIRAQAEAAKKAKGPGKRAAREEPVKAVGRLPQIHEEDFY